MDLEPVSGAEQSATGDTWSITGHLPVRLRVQLGDQIGRVYIMAGEMMHIGRAPDNDLVLDDIQVSRYHARLIRRGTALLIEDLGSTNGTLVSGRRITQPQVLQPGDTIAIGRTLFSIEGLTAPDTLAMAPLRPESPRHEVGAVQGATASGHVRSSTVWLLATGVAGLVIVVVLILALGGMLSYVLSTPA
ncbi:MAG: FHA domain-containing protein, partial [Anaerolineae bacterium]|nr:FHA domain-containing protein [Anaerolineae bacterium]